MRKCAVLGCGNMAKALIKKAFAQAFDVATYTPNSRKDEELAHLIGARVLENWKEKFDIVFLAMKPQHLEEASLQIQGLLGRETLVVSILAAVPFKRLQFLFHCKNILRLMPNTPAIVGHGLITYLSLGPIDDFQEILTILKKDSTLVPVQSEDDMDLTTAVSGSGPALVFELARIMSQYLVDRGIKPEMADLIVKKMFLGASTLMMNSSEDLTTLRNHVTSKGGVTYSILEGLKQREWEVITCDSLELGHMRAKELSHL